LDFCNDAIKSENIRGHIELVDHKRYRSVPAVKLTRFGVTRQFQGMHLGTNALNMVKKFFTMENRTGCRFITIDAYNKPEIIDFYTKNDFIFLTDKDQNKNNRAMFFDLIRFKSI
jgi:hypothetical protein